MLAEIYEYCSARFISPTVLPYYVNSTAGANAFIDVVSGNNDYGQGTPYFYAQPGYDNTTGLGVPLGMPFAQTICPNRNPVARLRKPLTAPTLTHRPAVPFAADVVPKVRGLTDRGPRAADRTTRIQIVLRRTTDVASDVPDVLVDRHAIVDALLNLLTNAQKYGGSPPVVKLRAYRDEKRGAVLEVSDNGAGIARGEHRRIFEKFYRIDDRLSRSREGSGLGLAIVKHIVRAHHGRVQLDSALGEGSTFRIVLPLHVESTKSKAAAPAVAEQAAPREEAGRA